MDDTFSVASQVFGYLKRTVCNLTEPDKFLENAKDDKGKTPTQSLEHEHREGWQLEMERRKRRSISPSLGTKRFKAGNSSIVVISGKELSFDTSESMQIGRHSDHSSGNTEDPVVCLNAIFNQLLWTLKYLKFNPSKSNEEMMEMVGTLCEGLEKIVVLSRLNFTDKEFRRFLGIADTLFTFIRSYGDEESLLVKIQTTRKIENLFDNFLDRFTEHSNSEEHLQVYGFIGTLMHKLNDEEIIKRLTDKLLLRIYATTTELWKAWVSCPNEPVQLVNPQDVNVFFFYCQLLEVLVASQSLANHHRESIHKHLMILEEDAGSLFSIFPNLALILYGAILATGVQQKSQRAVSPLKEIK